MASQQQWDSAINSYLSSMKLAGVGHSVRAQRRRYLVRLQGTYGNCGPWDVSTEQVADFLTSATCNRVSRQAAADAVEFFYAWGVQHGWVQDNPASNARLLAARS
jgi:hypothetical protein